MIDTSFRNFGTETFGIINSNEPTVEKKCTLYSQSFETAQI